MKDYPFSPPEITLIKASQNHHKLLNENFADKIISKENWSPILS